MVVLSLTYFQLLLEFVSNGDMCTLLSTYLDWIKRRMLERSSCSASFGKIKISDLDFADDAVIFVETLDILLGLSTC